MPSRRIVNAMKSLASDTSWATCKRCGRAYLPGFYDVHAAKYRDIDERHDPLMMKCRTCGQFYPRSMGSQFHSYQAGHRKRPKRGPEGKPERNAAIVAALTADPYLTFTAVSIEYGLTRERVRQIWLRATGQPGRDRHPFRRDLPKTCPTCGMTYERGQYKDHMAIAPHRYGETQYVRNQEWEQLYEDGLSSVQIARIYETSATHVVNVLNQRGVKMQPKGRKGGIQVRRTDVNG